MFKIYDEITACEIIVSIAIKQKALSLFQRPNSWVSGWHGIFGGLQ
jgi:hypothetical protein